MQPVLEPLVDRDRRRHTELGGACQLRRRLLAERARQVRHPLEVGARRRIGTGDQADREAGDHRVDPRLVDRHPECHADDHGGLPTPFDRREPQRHQHAEQDDPDRERHHFHVVRVDGSDHDQSHEVVEDRHGQQAEAQPRAAGSDQSQHSEREGGVGGHRRAPAICGRAARVEREVDQDGKRHSAQRGRQRKRYPAPVAQLSHVHFPLGFQAEDQEEEGHQALVDPLPQILGDAGVAEADRELGGPNRTRRSPAMGSSPTPARRPLRTARPPRRRSPW